MSWDGYVQALIDRKLVHGAIYGPPKDGSGAWFVASDGSNISIQELEAIYKNYGKDTMYTTGAKLGGIKYMYLSSNDFSPFALRCKKGSGGCHFVKSHTLMMVGIYDEGLKAEQAATAVESVVDSLIKANY